MGSVTIRFTVLLLAIVLTACRSYTPSLSTTATNAGNAAKPGSRYALKNDVGVLEPLDVSKIKPVIPRVEPRTGAGNKSPYTIDGHVYNVLKSEAGYTEVGVASWYGRKFQGFLTANGEKYDMFQLSAAHTTLPIPSYAKVTNLDNGKTVVVRINDRGPFHPGRIIDMSYAAAVSLGYAGSGTARVKVEAVLPDGARQSSRAPAPVETSQPVNQPVAIENLAKERQMIESGRGADYLQIGAFSSEKSAQALQTRLQAMTRMPIVISNEAAANGARLFKVRVGPLADDVQVQALQDALTAAKLGTPFKVRI
jgi:rare lipoprotein A